MRTKKSTDTGSAVMVEPAPAANLASETDYWHVNYMTRPYYKEGRSFGDYEAAYRFGWESAATKSDQTFEEAERAGLAGGWAAARGESPLSWDDVRDAVRDAWSRARRNREP